MRHYLPADVRQTIYAEARKGIFEEDENQYSNKIVNEDNTLKQSEINESNGVINNAVKEINKTINKY